MGRCYSRHNVCHFRSFYVGAYFTEADTSIILLREPAATQLRSLSEPSPLERLEVIIKCISSFSDNVSILSFKNFPNFSERIHSPVNN
jgi:hypothetical protein